MGIINTILILCNLCILIICMKNRKKRKVATDLYNEFGVYHYIYICIATRSVIDKCKIFGISFKYPVVEKYLTECKPAQKYTMRLKDVELYMYNEFIETISDPEFLHYIDAKEGTLDMVKKYIVPYKDAIVTKATDITLSILGLTLFILMVILNLV